VEGNILKGSTQRSGILLAMGDQENHGNYIQNVTIRNNVLTANNHVGIVVKGISRDIKIYNNTFYQNGREAIYVENDTNIDGVDIRNNLIYQSSNSNCAANCSYFPQAHIQTGRAVQNVTIDNNSYQPGTPNMLGRSDSHPITGAVRFADPTGLDFHILPGSSVIERGLRLASVPTDYDGAPRPHGAASDIGAFEHHP
jgi:hypothetical protein